LLELQSQEQEISEEVQQAVEQRPPVGTEVRLIELLRASSSGQQVDLRGLIIHLLEQGESEADLDALMKDLQSLFQKNQISIHISLVTPNKQ
jgi:sirohydrochlorin ferrochelatase